MNVHLGNNLKATVEKDKLTIVIDLKTELGMSKSGKSVLVASTNGNQKIPTEHGITIGINAYKNK